MNHHKVFSRPGAWRVWRRTCLPVCFVCLTGAASADSIGPGFLPATTPGGWQVYVEGNSYINANQLVSSAIDEDDSQVFLNTTAVLGTGPSLNPISSASGAFGGFADLTHGLLGVYTNATGGISRNAEEVDAGIFVNLTFVGTGTVDLTMHIAASTTGASDDGQAAGELFTQAGNFCTDPQFVGSCNDFSLLPVDVTQQFVVSQSGVTHQFRFTLSAYSRSFNSIDAAETATISMSLSPGLSVDQSQGFLTQTGEPDYFNSADAPEPGTPGMLLAGLGLISVRCGRWRRKRDVAK